MRYMTQRLYLDDILMVELGCRLLEAGAAGHLEAEEGTHRLLWGVGALLAFFLLCRRGGGCSLDHGGLLRRRGMSGLLGGRGRRSLDYMG